MKRNVNLQELSRDHHHGLLLGWKIRQGLKRSVPLTEISAYIEYFFEAALKPHFNEEETLVFSYLEDADPLKRRALSEHNVIEDQITTRSAFASVEQLQGLADKLDEHIRFEERVLFPYIESQLAANELEELGVSIAAVHQHFEESYQNEFWK